MVDVLPFNNPEIDTHEANLAIEIERIEGKAVLPFISHKSFLVRTTLRQPVQCHASEIGGLRLGCRVSIAQFGVHICRGALPRRAPYRNH